MARWQYLPNKPQNGLPGLLNPRIFSLKIAFNVRYVSKIAKVDHKKKKILIHFEGWNSRYDEWVSFDSKKIRPLPKDKVKPKTKVKEVKVL